MYISRAQTIRKTITTININEIKLEIELGWQYIEGVPNINLNLTIHIIQENQLK